MSVINMPTAQDYINYYTSYENANDYIIEICECEYDDHGNILDFATNSHQEDMLNNVPINTPMQLNIMNSDFSKIDDVCISITNDGSIIDGKIHFTQR